MNIILLDYKSGIKLYILHIIIIIIITDRKIIHIIINYHYSTVIKHGSILQLFLSKRQFLNETYDWPMCYNLIASFFFFFFITDSFFSFFFFRMMKCYAIKADSGSKLVSTWWIEIRLVILLDWDNYYSKEYA